MSQFGLQGHLNTIYETTEREFTFDVSDASSARAWQIVFRAALRECLKIDRYVLPDKLQTEYISTNDKGTYIEDKYALKYDDVAVPMYLLIPKAEPPYRPVIAFHGHGMGVNLILGNYDTCIQSPMNYVPMMNNLCPKTRRGWLSCLCAIEQQGIR